MIDTPGNDGDCPLCRSTEISPLYRLTDYTVAVCGQCGFQFQPNFQGGGSAGDLFNEDYFLVRQSPAFEPQLADYRKDPSIVAFERWLNEIERRISVGRLLDVGSALGTFLTVARQRGWQAEGVEISEFAANHARQAHHLRVFNGDLEHFQCEDQTFDVVTFWDSIEHVSHPRPTLTTACRLTRKGGLILLTTDNFDCLIADIARLFYRTSRGRIRYPLQRLFIAPNRSYFTDRTLRTLIEECGLRIIASEKMEYPLDKIKTNRIERLALQALYGAAWMLRRQAQLTVLAEKQ